jgi:hypothetical protein
MCAFFAGARRFAGARFAVFFRALFAGARFAAFFFDLFFFVPFFRMIDCTAMLC